MMLIALQAEVSCADLPEERAHKRSTTLNAIGRKASMEAFGEWARVACTQGDTAALKCIVGSGFGSRHVLSSVRTPKLGRNLAHVVCELPARPNSGPAPPTFGTPGSGQVGCLKLLVKLGCRALFTEVDDEGATPAHVAAGSGHVAALSTLGELAKNMSEDEDAVAAVAAMLLKKDGAGRLPAHLAAKGGHTACLQFIHGANPHPSP